MKVGKLIFLMFIYFVLCGQGFANETFEQVAHLKNVSGQVDIIRNSISTQAVAGDLLLQKDTIKTKSGTAGIIFIDGTLLSIGPDSEVKINAYVFEPKNEKYSFELFMQKGSAMYSSGKLGKIAPKSINLQTPRATIGIRGTKLILEVE